MTVDLNHVPESLKSILEDFEMATERERLELLLEYSYELPDLPEHLANDIEKMEQVNECQSPFFMTHEMHDDKVTFYFSVPKEAPTIRGFAAILAEGVNGCSPQQVLDLPNTFYVNMGLNRVLSPQRLNGINAVLNRMKRQMQPYLE